MTGIINIREFESVLSQSPAKRYKYFVSKTVDQAEVWGLRNFDEWSVMADNDGIEHFPVWPFAAYANACATDELAADFAAAIEVHEFIDIWLPNMVAKQAPLFVFPTPRGKGISISASRLLSDMSEELSRIE